MDNKCVCCGESVPEGRQVCQECSDKANEGFIEEITERTD